MMFVSYAWAGVIVSGGSTLICVLMEIVDMLGRRNRGWGRRSLAALLITWLFLGLEGLALHVLQTGVLF